MPANDDRPYCGYDRLGDCSAALVAEVDKLRAERDARLDPARVVAWATRRGQLFLFTDADTFRAWFDANRADFGELAWTHGDVMVDATAGAEADEGANP